MVQRLGRGRGTGFKLKHSCQERASSFTSSPVHGDQLELGLDSAYNEAPAVVPELRDEVARIWGLPLGDRVEVCFGAGTRSAITGILELHASPPYPWDPRDPLRLRISGFIFSSREIDRWTRL